MKTFYLLIIAIYFLWLASPACALEITCPESINVKENCIGKPSMREETGVISRKHGFLSILFGEDKNGQMEDDDVETQTSSKAVWYLSDRNKTYWVSCLYKNTAVQLARKVPKEMKVCEVIDSKNKIGTLLFSKAQCHE